MQVIFVLYFLSTAKIKCREMSFWPKKANFSCCESFMQ